MRDVERAVRCRRSLAVQRTRGPVTATDPRPRCGLRRRRPRQRSPCRPPLGRAHRPGVRRADQAADHRDAAGHDRARRCSWPREGLPPAWLVAGDARRRHAGRRQRQHAQLLPRPRHRRGHAPHPPAAAGHRRGLARARRWSSGSCSASLSVLWLGLLVNWLAAGLALAANLFYVFVYTMLLKRRTPQNIVWGGAAGCMQVLIGWAAVTGSLDWAPFVLFGVIFLWTPPHYWPLSMRFEDDYASAGVPMLPVVASRPRGRPAGRGLLLGDGAVLAAARAGRADRAGLRGRRRGAGRGVPGRGAPAARPGQARGRPARRSSRCGCSTTRSPT